jgi:2-pyrone-4,6-dicarboxylate lactonase
MRFTDSVTDTELERMHNAGVRGMRFAFARFMKQERISRQAFERATARVRHLGWHVKVHVEARTWRLQTGCVR